MTSLRFVCRPTSTKRSFSRAQRGFTLAELMAVISLSAFSLGFIFYLLIQSSRIYSSQDSYYSIHNAARYASMILEGELRRAGLMTALGPNDNRFCNRDAQGAGFWINNAPNNTFTRGLFPIYFENGSMRPNSTFETQTQNMHIRTDALEIMGNFATNSDFRATLLPNAIELRDIPDGGFDGFRRAFFNQGQLLSIRSSSGRMQIVQVDNNASFADTPSITGLYNTPCTYDNTQTCPRIPIVPTGHTSGLSIGFDEDQSSSSAFKCGIARGSLARVAPLMRMRYEICAHSVTVSAACIRMGNDSPLGQRDIGRWYLRRTPLRVTCSSPGVCQWFPYAQENATDVSQAHTRAFPPIDLIENVVDLQFWFGTQVNGQLNAWLPLATLPTGPSNPSGLNYARLFDSDTTSPATGNPRVDSPITGWPTNTTFVDQLRVLHYRLSVRGENEERGLAHRLRNNISAPIQTFNLRPATGGSGTAESSARVRTVTGGLLLYSMMQTR